MSEKDDSRNFRFLKTDIARGFAGGAGRAPGIRLPLIEYLAAVCGCMYLSDLRQRQHRSDLRRALQTAAHEYYTVWEWMDAAEYLTGKYPSTVRRSEIRDWLIEQLGRI